MTGCTEEWVWHLAKSYVNVNDYCWHKGIRHALPQHPCRPCTSCCSAAAALPRGHELMMNINALTCQKLISAGGIFSR